MRASSVADDLRAPPPGCPPGRGRSRGSTAMTGAGFVDWRDAPPRSPPSCRPSALSASASYCSAAEEVGIELQAPAGSWRARLLVAPAVVGRDWLRRDTPGRWSAPCAWAVAHERQGRVGVSLRRLEERRARVGERAAAARGRTTGGTRARPRPSPHSNQVYAETADRVGASRPSDRARVSCPPPAAVGRASRARSGCHCPTRATRSAFARAIQASTKTGSRAMALSL